MNGFRRCRVPPLAMVALNEVLSTAWVPPPLTVVSVAVPFTYWKPGLLIAVPFAVAPASTYCRSLAVMIVPLVVPPLPTYWWPPRMISVPLAARISGRAIEKVHD
jgi:glucose-6-phosphate dehydrogenase assembly protein OpcA